MDEENTPAALVSGVLPLIIALIVSSASPGGDVNGGGNAGAPLRQERMSARAESKKATAEKEMAEKAAATAEELTSEITVVSTSPQETTSNER